MIKRMLANLKDHNHPCLTTPLVIAQDCNPSNEELAAIIATVIELSNNEASNWELAAKDEALRDNE